MSKFFPLKLEDVSNFHFAFLSSILLICFTCTNVHAQNVPEAINYQAIVRDASSYLPISDQAAYVSVEFLDGPNGDVLYQEEFSSIQTGKTGLINLSLGQGEPLVNSFNSVSWESGDVWLRLSVDVGNGLNILQETPFNTVPYAFYAASSGSNTEDGDGDSTNELIQDITIDGSTLVVSEGGQVQSVDLSALPGLGDDADADPENELQEIELSGNELSITNNPLATPVDLSSYLDNTDNQDLTLSGTTLILSGDATPVDLSTVPGIGDDADADPTNELQNIESTDGSITVTRNGNDFDLSVAAAEGSGTIINDGQNTTISGTGTSADPYSIAVPDNLDNDSTNEIQDISTDNSAGNISLSDGSTLTLNVNDADADPENELQEIELSGNELSITNNPLATPVDLSSYLDNTDNQDLTLSGTTLNLSGDATSVDLSALPGLGDDADADPTNEIQDLSLSGSILSLSGDGTTVDLSSLPGLGDDADADPENELQNIQLSGDFLSLTNVSPAAQVDLSPYDQSDLSQGHIFIGDGSNEATEVEITGDLILDDTGETKVAAIMGTNVSGVPPTNGQVLAYNAADSEWQPRSPASVIAANATRYYSIDPLDFRELTDNNIGVDLEVNNALKFFDDDAPFAMMRNVGIIEMMAPIHIPHGSTIDRLKIYFRNNSSTNLRFSLYRKNMTDFSVGNELLSTVQANGPIGDQEFDIAIPVLNEVDNATYSYRLYVRFSNLESDDGVSLDDVDQRVYGAVIEYTTN